MDKKWILQAINRDVVTALKEELKSSELTCTLLAQRGLSTRAAVYDFVHPDLSKLHDPFLMKDMDKAVNRILNAMKSREKILIFGDYDVDGTTSVALMVRFFREIYHPELLDFYIPDRYKEGYGISKQGIDFAKANGFTLVVALDCGIKAVDLINYAKSIGIDFIVCDHHLPDTTLPDAVAILNTKQKDCKYPFKELCGCGVGFKLATALAQRLKLPSESYLRYLDLVVTAIGADIVPVTCENRILAFHGLQRLNSAPLPGIKALVELNQITHFTISRVVFIIAPRVNAAGRMADAATAVKLFIENDPVKAMEFAKMLQVNNSERTEADRSITEQALAMIAGDERMAHRNSTVLYHAGWHKGVVGIVASRLIERYYRPTIVLTGKNGMVGGSARSVQGFNLYEAIHACREYLVGYGGHFAAAGMTLMQENIEAFSNKFEEIVSATIAPECLAPCIHIDAEISLTNANQNLFNTISRMEPYGPENLRPIFMTKNVQNTQWTRIVKDDHVRFVVQKDGITFTGIGFNLAEKYRSFSDTSHLDMAYTLQENEWNGNTSIQMEVQDFRIPE